MTHEYVVAATIGAAAEHISSLPLTGVTYGRVLGGAGTIQATLKLAPLSPTVQAPPAIQIPLTWDGEPLTWDGEDLIWGVTIPASANSRVLEQNRIWKDATEPGRRVVFAVRDGVPMGCYVWWRRIYDPASQTMTLEGAELWSVFRRRLITWTASYSAAVDDQLAIARDIINRAQTIDSLGIAVGSEVSGRKRARSYFDYEAKPVAEAVEQLAQVLDGFDFSIDTTLSGGVFTNTFVLDYPRRGRRAAQSGFSFAWGRNIVRMGWSEDASATANEISGLGKGSDNDMVRTRIADGTALSAGYPLLQESLPFKDVSEPDTLVGHVRFELLQRSRPLKVPEVDVLADGDPPLGAYMTGDDVHIVMPAGVDPFWPDGFTEARRIHAITVKVPDDGGVETVTLALGEALAGV
jgi:hypothetical protein